MELKQTTIRGHQVNVIFNGSTYFFMSNFYGCIAIAERDYTKETMNPASAEFTLFVGNHHTTGGSLSDCAVITAAKRYINKEESKYIKKRVTYIETVTDLANAAIEIYYKLWNYER